MELISIRPARQSDVLQLKRLWKGVFHDTTACIDAFFSLYAPEELAFVAAEGPSVVSAVYGLPTGGLAFPDGSVLPASMTYALATDPNHRGKGYAASIQKEMLALLAANDTPYSVLHPAEESLFRYYSDRLGYLDVFTVREAVVSPRSLSPSDTQLRAVSPEEYNAFRDRFLRGWLYLRVDQAGMAYQEYLCASSGGGLFLILGHQYTGCACCELDDSGSLLVKELLCPDQYLVHALSALKDLAPAARWLVRTPADLGAGLDGQIRSFGQLRCTQERSFSRNDGYYGLAFD